MSVQSCRGGQTLLRFSATSATRFGAPMQTLVGVWKLIETRAFNGAGREVPSPFGPQPMGVAIFDAERGMAMGCDSRTTLPPEAKRAFVAYCGRYTFDGTKLVTHADGA